MDNAHYLKTVVRWLLLLTAFTPLLVFNATIYPFVFPKIVFYRALVEVALALALVYAILLPAGELKNLLAHFCHTVKKSTRKPVPVFFALFFVSLVVSALFADNGYRAFWGDIERGVGVFGFMHFYLFVILALAFFKDKDWDWFFKFSLMAGAALILLAFLQYFGLKLFFLKPAQQARPESFIGNSAFFATHLIFLAMFAFVVFRNTRAALKNFYSLTNNFWQYFSLGIMFLSLVTIFITGTRGAILGVGAGFVALLVYFVFSSNRKFTNLHKYTNIQISLRSASIATLALIIIFSGIFWTTRANDLWQKIPGLDRLARTATMDINDSSTQFRIITWRVSWEAFKERPLFGWGPENYIVAYEKHYDPNYALYGETWLDRAHNTFFDLLVMQGIFGVFAYFGLFFSLLYVIANKIKKEDFYLAGVFVAGFVAYLVQNLVLFDQIVSYAAFFVLIGYILHIEKQTEKLPAVETRSALHAPYEYLAKYAAAVVIVALGYSLIAYNLIPYIQAVAFRKSPGISGNAYDVEGAIQRAITPYNFAQYNIRSQGIDTVYLGAYFDNEEYVSNPKFRPLGKTLIEMIGDLT